MTAVLLVNDKDKKQLSALLDRVFQGEPPLLPYFSPGQGRADEVRERTGAPTFQLASSPAFICTTYVWRQGDKTHKDRQFENAGEWYLMGTHPVMKALEKTTWPKSFRCVASPGLDLSGERKADMFCFAVE
jgi:hypothetical protein